MTKARWQYILTYIYTNELLNWVNVKLNLTKLISTLSISVIEKYFIASFTIKYIGKYLYPYLQIAYK